MKRIGDRRVGHALRNAFRDPQFRRRQRAQRVTDNAGRAQNAIRMKRRTDEKLFNLAYDCGRVTHIRQMVVPLDDDETGIRDGRSEVLAIA